jgi:hypothetical protein
MTQQGATTIELVPAPIGSGKSTRLRADAVKFVNEHPELTVVIALPRHGLGEEQITLLEQEHPNANVVAAIWRGRHADDPEVPGKKMCQRSEDAKALEASHLSVEAKLCKQGRGQNELKCPLYDVCGFQRQKRIEANIWFVAHESLVHEKPKPIHRIGWLLIDESPLDAFMFGVGSNSAYELPLDALRDPPPAALSAADASFLKSERDELYKILDRLVVPIDQHKGVPIAKSALGWLTARHNINLEWRGKVEPDIRPDMTAGQVRLALKAGEGNSVVAARVALWQLVAHAQKSTADLCGRIQVHRGHGGRIIRMVGLRPLTKGWAAPTLICDAMGDAELLRAIWPKLRVEPPPWPQLARPPHVGVFQVVDRSVAKLAIAVEGNDLPRRQKAALRTYAALLVKALEYGGAPVAAIMYKSTEEWIQANCIIPRWLTITHYGAVAGTNAYRDVAALFVIGRALLQAEAITRQAEALFGAYLPERDYVEGISRIPIVPDVDGHTAIEVKTYRHPDDMAERLRWQVCEGSVLDAAGRARAGLRTADKPLDIHLWTDVPVPELGPVVPQLWDDVAVGLDGLMLATAGVWLENTHDAEKAFPDLLTAEGLQKEQRVHSRVLSLLETPIREVREIAVVKATYQRRGRGCLRARAAFLSDITDPKEWLEQRLGPLAKYEIGWPRTAGRKHLD